MSLKLAIAVCSMGLGAVLAMALPRSRASRVRGGVRREQAGQLQGHGHQGGMDQSPHVWIHVDVKKPDGTVENWAIEAGTPNVLFRRGFTKQSLRPGTEIVVDGYQAKDGSRRANGRDLTFADGRKLFLGSSGTGAPVRAEERHAEVAGAKRRCSLFRRLRGRCRAATEGDVLLR